MVHTLMQQSYPIRPNKLFSLENPEILHTVFVVDTS
jgi:hypothetical protein